jgi:Glycosyl hydrolase family 76
MRASAAVACSACALVGALAFGSPACAASANDTARSVAAYVAMQRYLFDVPSGTYRAAIGAPAGSEAWPVSQALAATIAVTRLPGARTDAGAFAARAFHQLAPLRDGSVYRSNAGADVYYDDNEWIAQDLLDWNAFHADRKAVAGAAAIFGAVVRAWDTDETTPCPGGVYWTAAPRVRDRNTVSTVNGAVIGLRLYMLTRRPVYLYWARRMLDWVNTYMLSPDGLYWDHVTANGSLDRHVWSYNQGSPIAAYLLLYEATGDTSALAQAERLADGTLRTFSGRWLSEPPEFAAIFFRHVLALAAIDGRPQYVAAAQAYADAAWEQLRDPATGLFAVDGTTTLLQQAAFVQLYAHLAITDSGVATQRPPQQAAGTTGSGSAGAGAGLVRAPQDPRRRPARAGRSGRWSRTTR